MPPINDNFASATALTGTSGSPTGELLDATQETGEPPLDVSAAPAAGTVWYTFTPTNPGEFVVALTTAVPVVVELWTGDTLDTLVQQDIVIGTSGNIDAFLAQGIPVYLRVYPHDVPTTSTPFTLTWTFTASTNVLDITIVTDCYQAPGTVVVHVGNVTPGDTINFTIDNAATPALSLLAPDAVFGITVGKIYFVPLENQLLFVGVPVDEGTDQGTHTLKIAGVQSGQSIVSFNVLHDPLDGRAVAPVDQSLTGLPTTTKWIFRNPAPRGATPGETYVWEIDPDHISSPFPDKVITDDHTTAPDGQPLEWEGTPKAVQWQLGGTLLSQTQLEAFQRFAALYNRVWLIDHFKRAWLVSVEQLDAEPQIKGFRQYPWIHTWKMSLLIWRGPVDVS